MTPLRWTILMLVVAAAFAHAPGLAGGFIYDDFRFVANNEALASASPYEIFAEPATHTADDDRDVYRPIRTLSHAFDRSRWDLEPFGYRLHNLFVHLVNIVLGVVLIRRLIPDVGWFSVCAGVGLLALHPVGVEVVGFISSRGDLYALAFALMALLIVAPATDPREERPLGTARFLGGMTCALLAALSKESTLVLPAIAAWHAWTIRRSRPGAETLALALGAAGAFAIRQWALAGLSPIQTAPHGGDLLTQAGWAFYGVGRMVQHIAVPANLAVDYPQFSWAEGTTSWAEPRTWLVLVACTLPFALMRRAPRWSFAAGWFLIAYLPSSSLLVTLRSLVNDRYVYTALLPLGLAAGLALSSFFRDPAARRQQLTVPQVLGIALAALLALFWISETRERSRVFHSDRALWTHTHEVNPTSVPALIGLAALESYAQAEGDPQAAGRRRTFLEKAIVAAPPGTMLEGWALGELGEHLLYTERNPAAAITPLFQALQLTRATRDRDEPETDEVVTALFLAEAHSLLGHHDQADSVLRYSLADHANSSGDAIAVLSIKRAQLAFHRLQTEATTEAIRRAGQALLEAERHASNNTLVIAMRKHWNDIEVAPPTTTSRPPSEDSEP